MREREKTNCKLCRKIITKHMAQLDFCCVEHMHAYNILQTTCVKLYKHIGSIKEISIVTKKGYYFYS